MIRSVPVLLERARCGWYGVEIDRGQKLELSWRFGYGGRGDGPVVVVDCEVEWDWWRGRVEIWSGRLDLGWQRLKSLPACVAAEGLLEASRLGYQSLSRRRALCSGLGSLSS